MVFTASIEGLEGLLERFTEDRLQSEVVKAVGAVARDLNSLLNTRVQAVYAVGNRSLNSVLVGTTESNLRRGTGFVETGLTYKSVPIPLRNFPINISFSSQPSTFIAPNVFTPNIAGKITRKKPTEVISIQIRKGRYTKIDGAFRGNVRNALRVLRRKNFFTGGDTWNELPSRNNLLGKRSSYYEVNAGPSLAVMARIVFEEDKYIQDFKSNFATEVGKKLNLW